MLANSDGAQALDFHLQTVDIKLAKIHVWFHVGVW